MYVIVNFSIYIICKYVFVIKLPIDINFVNFLIVQYHVAVHFILKMYSSDTVIEFCFPIKPYVFQ
jgi:hypothetical protein